VKKSSIGIIVAHPVMTARHARQAVEEEIARRQRKCAAPVRFEEFVDEWREEDT
jgi:hypothetical protein|tara:strand:- start:10142 stop:10303 length:162 start_codon:yes stop_codon:yes gene_type:complete